MSTDQRGVAIEQMVLGLLVVALIFCFVMFVVTSIRERREWEAFRVAHACKVVGHMDGNLVTGVGPAIGGNGGVAVTTSVTPDKEGWLCDDGMTYWKDAR